MDPDELTIPDSRVQAVRSLIAQAQAEGTVALKSLLAVELCVLGGPRHAYFDEMIARAWLGIGDRPRKKLTENAIKDLRDRKLLIPSRSGEQPERPGLAAYSLSPELGVVLAAHCRPGFVVANEIAGTSLRQPVLFAFGDQGDPVQALLAEIPRNPEDREARDFAKQHGPLGWIYSYMLFSRDFAARFLADWVIEPAPARPDVQDGSPRIITRYQPSDQDGKTGFRMTIRGDGASAHVDAGSARPARIYDREELRALMADLLSGTL